jgi:hypothetical protein
MNLRSPSLDPELNDLLEPQSTEPLPPEICFSITRQKVTPITVVLDAAIDVKGDRGGAIV